MQNAAVKPQPALWDFFILIVSLYVLVSMGLIAVFNRDPQVQLLFDKFDFFVCLIFLGDFSYRFLKAESKLKFMRWGWIDLLASIPAVGALRWGRLFRVVRILRLFRAFRSMREIVKFLVQQREKSAVMATVLMLLFAAFIGAILMLEFEADSPSNIKTAGQALWWSIVTMTTVGYGDYVPVTPAGRILASVMMIIGICLIGVISGTFASWFTTSSNSGNNDAQREEYLKIRADLDAIKKKLGIDDSTHSRETAPKDSPALR
jgi:voltage-gated potassium channel